jgi:hypothetical protein
VPGAVASALAGVLPPAMAASDRATAGPWGAREWAGATLYAALFVAALVFAWRLVRSSPQGGSAPPGSP